MPGPTHTLHLRIITPTKVIIDEYVDSVTAPSAEGEITILPFHTNLFSMLNIGVLKYKVKEREDLLAIGGGFLETDGREISILVPHAYNQSEIDEKITQKAIEEAKKTLSESKDQAQIHQATLLLRRSLVDMKLIKKRRKAS